MRNFSICPQCEYRSYETRVSYDRCFNCDFSSIDCPYSTGEHESAIPDWVWLTLKSIVGGRAHA